MKLRTILLLTALLPVSLRADEWRPLLDADLSLWDIYMGVPHKSTKVEGYTHKEGTDHMSGVAIGLGKDPLGVFKVVEEDGQPVLHISGEIYAGLSTKEEFENYHLSMEFKWGDKKWPPRENTKRDSGILFHCVGEHGAFWKVWMRSLEFQVQENDCGDFIPLAGTAASIPVGPYGYLNQKQAVYSPDGTLFSNTNYTQHGPSKENSHGEWNLLELYTVGDRAIFVVNGTPNMALFDTAQKGPEGKGLVALTKGKIQLQSEAAEVFYRDIKLRPISSFPEEFEKFTTRPEGAVTKWDPPKEESK
ncbi:DUF1080 domain-containing protein [Roseibacillus persicicus]|uniref:3-keto-disaccharide hydrolase n=1 Tax=Roseibacillus persicicus TaxID=454148 RepID=UPI00398A8E30